MTAMKSAFIAGIALSFVTIAVCFLASRDVSLTAASFHRPKPPSPPVADAPAAPPMPIAIDGITVIGQAPPVAGPSRLVARSVTMTIDTSHIRDVRDGIDALVRRHHGRLVGIVAN